MSSSRILLKLLVVLVCGGFLSLGTWQLYRLQWKLALIERVEQRAHAPAVPAPERSKWSSINAKEDEYRHVQVSGVFLYELTIPVYASTQFGPGYWLLTPLRLDDSSFVYINRGFVSTLSSAEGPPAVGLTAPLSTTKNGKQSVSVSGLLRLSEPKGTLLRRNQPEKNRWYSRDIQAFSTLQRLAAVAPYFIDRAADPVMKMQQFSQTAAQVMVPFDQPMGGLTVINFYNNHLVYAITWYALALLLAGSCMWIMRKKDA